MGYSQFVTLRLRSENLTLGIREAKLEHGKFYETGDKDKELDPSAIKAIRINTGAWHNVNACGKDSAAVGTEGFIELVDTDNDRVLGKYRWDCPYWSSANTSAFEWADERLTAHYYFKLEPGNVDSGPIGNAYLVLVKL